MSRNKLMLAFTVILLSAGTIWFALRPVPVKTATADYGSAALFVYASGQVVPEEKINLRSKTVARIARFHVEEGQQVKKCDLLVSLESDEAMAQLSAARAELAQMETDTGYKRREYTRIQKLYAQQAVSQREHDNALSLLLSAENALNRARANVEAFQARTADYSLFSPFDGLILEKLLDKGSMVTNTDGILAMATSQAMSIEGKVDELDADRVRVGQKVLLSLDSLPGKVFEGAIRSLAPRVDYATKSFKIKIDLPSDLTVRPGMSAELNILVQEKAKALLVPANAVVEGTTVWIVNNNQANKKLVKTGLRDSRKIEILSGLKQGDQVILSPSGLKEGSRVNAKPEQKKEGSE